MNPISLEIESPKRLQHRTLGRFVDQVVDRRIQRVCRFLNEHAATLARRVPLASRQCNRAPLSRSAFTPRNGCRASTTLMVPLGTVRPGKKGTRLFFLPSPPFLPATPRPKCKLQAKANGRILAPAVRAEFSVARGKPPVAASEDSA